MKKFSNTRSSPWIVAWLTSLLLLLSACSGGSGGGGGGGKNPDPEAGTDPSTTPDTSQSLSLLLSANDGATGFEPYLTDGTAAGTRLVKDINTNTSSNVDGLFNVDGATWFVADDGVHGRELWKMDNATYVTSLVKDINPGKGGGITWWLNPTLMGNVIYFTANDGVNGEELWKSDGTASGTVMVKDINPGAGSGVTFLRAAVVGNVLYFAASDSSTAQGDSDSELWRSDGTESGTVRVKDINPGSAAGSYPQDFIVVGSTICFVAYDGTANTLWTSDGTADGTTQLSNIRPQWVGEASRFLKVDNTFYFVATDATHGTELWKSDGTVPGTVLVKDINPGTGSGIPTDSFGANQARGLVAIGSTVYFYANDGSTGSELWKSDGTDAGTMLVKDIRPGTGSSTASYNIWANIVVAGSRLFFTASDGTNGNELWTSDGTPDGTILMQDIVPGAAGGELGPVIPVGDTLYFRFYDNVRGSELWKSDGTVNGTELVKNINPGAIGGTVDPWFTVAGNQLFFVGGDSRLWMSDGTPNGTEHVTQINAAGGWESIYNLNATGNTLLFTASDGIHGSELWRSDGTPSGTVMAADINTTVTDSSYVANAVTMGGIRYFAADDGTGFGRALWRSDGTATGTWRVKNVNPDNRPIVAGDRLFFAAWDNTLGYELWTSDGTESGTHVVKDINPGNGYAYVTSVGVVGNTFYFAATDGTHGIEPWKTDGTADGTMLVKDINPGPANSFFGDEDEPGDLALVGDTFYFLADDGTNGVEVWKSDGTESGTQLLKDANPGAADSFFSCYKFGCALDVVGTRVYFTNSNGILWVSDGTEAGTQTLTDLAPAAQIEDAYMGVGLNGTMYFMAWDADHGLELWKTDGTAAGTALVKDLTPGPDGTNAYEFNAVGDRVFFVVRDASNAYTLWTTDGTEAGTQSLKEISPAAADEKPYAFTAAKTLLYFAANDGVHGVEAWVSDGTPDGTHMVKDIDPGTEGGLIYYYGETPFFIVDDTALFIAYDPSSGAQLWKTDGTEANTARVTDLNGSDEYANVQIP